MAGLTGAKNGDHVARKGIPTDVRDAYARLYGVRWEAILTLPANTSKHDLKARHGEWLAEIESGSVKSGRSQRATSIPIRQSPAATASIEKFKVRNLRETGPSPMAKRA